MKTNKYADLIKFGLKPSTLMKLSESSINTLHKNLIEEKTDVCKNCGMKVCKCKTSKKEETKEYQDVATKIRRFTSGEVSSAKTKGESLPGGKAVKLNPDGSMDVTMEGEMGESKSKKQDYSKINPWKVCHSQLGPKKTRKFERCVMAVKDSIKEGKNPFSVILENKIVSLLETHLKPKMKKGELMDLIKNKNIKTPIGKLGTMGGSVSEDKKEKEAPTKNPGTKTPPKPKTKDPFRPEPHKQPKPKAKTETKEAVMDAPAPTKKPVVEPGTKTPPKPKTKDPFRPEPHKQPNPKAKRKTTLPSWLTFNNLGIKFKK